MPTGSAITAVRAMRVGGPWNAFPMPPLGVGGVQEVVRDPTCDGLSLVEQGDGNRVAVPDRHGDGHRLTHGPSEAEDDGSEDPRTRVPQDRHTRRLPAGCTQAQGGLSLVIRDR